MINGIKRIKIISLFINTKGDDMNGSEIDALVITDDVSSSICAYFYMNGYSSPWSIINAPDMVRNFEIIRDIGISKDDLSDLNKSVYDLGEEVVELSSTLALTRDERDEAIDAHDKILEDMNNKKVSRDCKDTGYVILPLAMLDDELSKEFITNPDLIITPRELVAMATSAQMEICKGDISPASLNVKLYKATEEYADHEIDRMIDNGNTL